MLARFQAHIEDRFPELLQEKFLLACSGGLDSTVLMHLCNALQMNFVVAHCNFGLRGDEGDQDALWVEELANKINKECIVKNFDTASYVNKYKVSIQMAARVLRYSWFEALQSEMQLRYCVTAHHADDSLETFLINLSRGTGLKGLMGIPEKTETLARPLLKFTRKEIEAFAKEQNLIWREDSSNRELKYLRNQIRHELVPRLKELHPSFMENFAQTQEHLRDTYALFQNHLEEIRELAFTEEDGVLRIRLDVLKKLSPQSAYLHGLFAPYGFREWNDVESLLSSIPGKQVLSPTHRLIKDREHLLLQLIAPEESEDYDFSYPTTGIEHPVVLRFETVQELGPFSKKILYVDKETLKDKFTVRKWKKGDYFYPLGMKGHKKLLSKYFKDEKMDLIAKEEQWLLCTDNAVVWVIGRRADERFKVTDKTKQIIKITLEG